MAMTQFVNPIAIRVIRSSLFQNESFWNGCLPAVCNPTFRLSIVVTKLTDASLATNFVTTQQGTSFTVPKAKRSVIAVCHGRSEDTFTKQQKQIVKDAYRRGVVLRVLLANFSYTGTNRPDKRSVH